MKPIILPSPRRTSTACTDHHNPPVASRDISPSTKILLGRPSLVPKAIFVFVQILAIVAIFRSTQTITTSYVGDADADLPRKLKSVAYAVEKVASGIPANEKTRKSASAPQITKRRLPTLEELTSINTAYSAARNNSCPEGYSIFHDIVLPRNVTHKDRKIPKVVHITAKSRCVTPRIKKHILKWKFPDHSLYFHDDTAVYKLLDYAINDRNGYELVQNMSLAAMCITSGATLSDIWRYTVLYYYGGIYTDIDNAPGKIYSKSSMIGPTTDGFFFVESIGTVSHFLYWSK